MVADHQDGRHQGGVRFVTATLMQPHQPPGWLTQISGGKAQDVFGARRYPLGNTSGHPSPMAKRSPDPVDRYVGARIRMRRLMLKLSQTELADALGLTFQQVQKYEKGTNRIGASRLQHIASILQVPVAFFFEQFPVNRSEQAQTPDAPSAESVTAFVSTADGLKLIQAFASIKNTKMRRCIVQMVEHIVRFRHD
jgi:transcriptional regulator with XRE-family HTH domain